MQSFIASYVKPKQDYIIKDQSSCCNYLSVFTYDVNLMVGYYQDVALNLQKGRHTI
jgi:hypothetical protein